jgi:hypothetical protein
MRSITFALIVTHLALPHAVAEVDFTREILPLLSDRCFQCHGPDANIRKADLRLDQEAPIKEVRDSGVVVVPGNPEASLLMARIRSTDPDEVMPPPEIHRDITETEAAILEQWIREGASWGKHWAFESVERPALPVTIPPTSLAPLDAFVAAKAKAEGLALAAEAPANTLNRRIALDLSGLPSTDSFDTHTNGYDRQLDRLLASPRYGERMAWEWLEAARYADSNGYQGDNDRTMWPWRDWVVDAFNRNLPWDTFTIWQLAGDLLPDATPEQQLATGFCRNHMINGEGGRIPEENRVDYVMDMTETMGTVWMGLTLTCARCHDHKFDPLAQKEYYQLTAYFNQTPVTGGGGNPQTPPNLAWPSTAQAQQTAVLEKRLQTALADLARFETGFAGIRGDAHKLLPTAVRKVLAKSPRDRDAGQLKTLQEHFTKAAPVFHSHIKSARDLKDQLDRLRKSVPKVMVMADKSDKRKTFLLDRGLYNKPSTEVQADLPSSFSDSSPKDRLGLAQWLVSRDHPLSARVTVNRFWQQVFGMGLVKTPEDFGVQSGYPLQAELLDWLAAEFMDSGWDVKRLMRLILASATYRQDSASTPEMIERDPNNQLLVRGPRFRMPSWMIRDQALAASGLLVQTVGGPSVHPYQPDGVWADVTFGKKRYQQGQGPDLYRRSLYTFWRRIIGPTAFFDVSSRQTCSVTTARTNTPLQALSTLNDVTYVEAARALSEQSSSVEEAFQCILGRPPSVSEAFLINAQHADLRASFVAAGADAAREFLTNGTYPSPLASNEADLMDQASFAAVCLALLNLDETLTKE